jgi:hypothetical protein
MNATSVCRANGLILAKVSMEIVVLYGLMVFSPMEIVFNWDFFYFFYQGSQLRITCLLFICDWNAKCCLFFSFVLIKSKMLVVADSSQPPILAWFPHYIFAFWHQSSGSCKKIPIEVVVYILYESYWADGTELTLHRPFSCLGIWVVLKTSLEFYSWW